MQFHKDIRFQELIERMEAFHVDNRVEDMQLLLEKLQTLSETEQDDIGLAASYFYRDILSDDTPSSPSYMQYVKRSLKISENKNIPYYQMKASNSLGAMYSEISDFHTSLEYYLSALHIARAHPEYRYESLVLNNIGNLFVWLEDYSNAAAYLELAYYKSIDERLDDRMAIDIITLNLVELYSNLNNEEKVRKWEALSHDLVKEEAAELILCIILIYEARQFMLQGATNKVVENIHKFLEISHKLTDYIYVFHCYTGALRLSIQMNDFPLSKALIDQLTQVQRCSSFTTFAYDYAVARVEYYQAFCEHLEGDATAIFQEYFIQGQFRINQLHNTYAQSLSVKIALEAIKSENKNVRQQNDLLQKNIELDIFTNLYNKVSTEKYVRLAIAERPAHIMQALLLIDIDLFKRINDNYGHVVGDQIITQVADILASVNVSSKIAGRFGGDEFLVFLKHQDSVASIKAVAEDLLSTVRAEITLPDNRVKEITFSIGICLIDHDIKFEDAFILADQALYKAKELGRNQYVFSAAQVEETDTSHS